MILITGGAYQGKTAYAQAHVPYEMTDGSCCAFDEVKRAKILKNYHILVRRLIDADMDAEAFTQELCAENPACIILIDEIGSGIIPLEKSERIWRETVGRCGCIIAAHADSVIRLVCGIPTPLKGALL